MTEGNKPTNPAHRPRQGGGIGIGRIDDPLVVEKMKEVIRGLRDAIYSRVSGMEGSESMPLLREGIGPLIKGALNYVDSRIESDHGLQDNEELKDRTKSIRVGVARYGFDAEVAYRAEAVQLVAKSGGDDLKAFLEQNTDALVEHFTALGRQRFEELEAQRAKSRSGATSGAQKKPQDPKVKKKMLEVADCLHQRAMEHIGELEPRDKSLFFRMRRNIGYVTKFTKECIHYDAENKQTSRKAITRPLRQKVNEIRRLVLRGDLNPAIAAFSEALRGITKPDAVALFQSDKEIEGLTDHFQQLGQAEFESKREGRQL